MEDISLLVSVSPGSPDWHRALDLLAWSWWVLTSGQRPEAIPQEGEWAHSVARGGLCTQSRTCTLPRAARHPQRKRLDKRAKANVGKAVDPSRVRGKTGNSPVGLFSLPRMNTYSQGDSRLRGPRSHCSLVSPSLTGEPVAATASQAGAAPILLWT